MEEIGSRERGGEGRERGTDTRSVALVQPRPLGIPVGIIRSFTPLPRYFNILSQPLYDNLLKIETSF